MVTLRASKATLKSVVFFLFLFGGAHSAFPADGASAAPIVSPATGISPEVAEAMDHLEPLWENMKTDVVSCDAKFQIYYQITPHVQLTQPQIHELLTRYQLADHPEKVNDFLKEYSGTQETLASPVHHIFQQGGWTRHDTGLLSHVDLADFSFIRDGDNRQIQVYDPGLAPSIGQDLGLFRLPLKTRSEGNLPVRAERDGDVIRLETVGPASGSIAAISSKNTVDWATGIPLNREQSMNSEILQEGVCSGLTTFAGGITFPRCSTTIRYKQGNVLSIDLALLNDARFNEPIPDETFVVEKPADWTVLDFRGDHGGKTIDVPDSKVADVRTLIPEVFAQLPGVAATQFQKTSSLSFPLRAVLIMNGTALIAMGIWMWRSASLNSHKH